MSKELKLAIIEDSREDAVLMDRMVARHGYATSWELVQNLNELSVALDKNPDVILADYRVPNLDLDSVLELVKGHRQRPPVIVVSGAVTEETIAATIRHGAADYVTKDRLQRLGPAIERALIEAEHRRHEHELEVELRLRNLAFASIADGVVITDPTQPQHPIMDCNPAFATITGYRRDEIIGQSFHFMEGPYTDGKIAEQIRHAISATETFRGEIRYRRKDGTSFSAELQIQPLSDSTAPITRSVVVIRDVTEQRSAAIREAQHLAALAHFERLKSAGEMASGLAHELNQPLTAIVLQSENALQYAEHMAAAETSPLKPLFIEAVSAISQQAARAGAIIQLLRRLIKKGAPTRSTVSMCEVIQDTLRIMEPDFRQNQVNVVFHSSPMLPTVLGDKIQLEQVLINLLRNAVEAMKDTPVPDRRIELNCREEPTTENTLIAVTVSDQGHGLAAEGFQHLFENFYTTKPQGIGLGLAICRSIIESHGGQIECHPNPVQGVKFRFTLPIQKPA